MDLPTLISRTSPFLSLKVYGVFVFSSNFINHSGSDLGLHCLSMSHKKTLGSYVLRRPEFSLRYETVLIFEYTNLKKKRRGRGSGGPGDVGVDTMFSLTFYRTIRYWYIGQLVSTQYNSL